MGIKYSDPPETNENEAGATSITMENECPFIVSEVTSMEDHQDEVYREEQ